MVRQAMYQKILELKKQGLSQTQIALKLDISRKTVRKYYNMDEAKFIKYQRKHFNRNKVFEHYREDVLEVYAENDNKRLNKSAVYDYLEEKYGKLPGNEKTLRNYINFLIQTDALVLETKTRIYKKVPELPYGKQMQLDFGEYRFPGGIKLYIFVCVLSASRYKYVKFQTRPFKTIDVILHLLDSFDYCGGIPEEIVIDQDRLLVVSENHGDIIYTNDFDNFKNEIGFNMYVCRKRDPETKGKVENLVKFVKVNFLQLRVFGSEEEANTSLSKWLTRRANGKISQANKKIPLEFIEEERMHLRKPRNSIFRKDSLLGREDRIVSDNYISVQACSYGVPNKYENKKVEIYTTKSKVFIFDINTGKEIINYDLCLIPGHKIMQRNFKRDSGVTLKDLKEEVVEMFDLTQWKIFLDANFKKFSRYNRDQCIEAKKYFKKNKIDKQILDKALEYCLENGTLSFSNLNDTYKHYYSMHKESIEYFGKENIKKMRREFYKHPGIDVKIRSIEDYQRLASSGGAE